ncbi:hypothetical protein QG37_06495 [Candidozyma auris]|nr:hypothetical protein QG37_06495 [[Candida] auris]
MNAKSDKVCHCEEGCMKSEEKKKGPTRSHWSKQHHSVYEFCEYYFGMGIVPVSVMD